MIDDFSRIGEGKFYPPIRDIQRQVSIQRNRAAYNGDFRLIGIEEQVNGERQIQFNWFRRISQFFTEFIFSESPVIKHSDPRVNAYIKAITPVLTENFRMALTDMVRFGTGVVAHLPDKGFAVYQPDNWYAVVNRFGEYQGDVIAYITNDRNEVQQSSTTSVTSGNNRFSNNQYVTIYKLPVNGKGSKAIHDFNGSDVGSVEDGTSSSFDLVEGMRNVFTMFAGYAYNYEGVSLFEDIKPSVAEVTDRLTGLSRTLKHNQRPHLYGPDGMIVADDNGKTTLDRKGMFLPIPEGASPPGYLQWDSGVEAVKTSVKYNMDNIFDMTGLSRMLHAETSIAALSGLALKRMMMPFVAKLNTYKAELEKAMRLAIVYQGRYNQHTGQEVMVINPMDIEFEWGYEQLFEDQAQLMTQMANAMGGENRENA